MAARLGEQRHIRNGQGHVTGCQDTVALWKRGHFQTETSSKPSKPGIPDALKSDRMLASNWSDGGKLCPSNATDKLFNCSNARALSCNNNAAVSRAASSAICTGDNVGGLLLLLGGGLLVGGLLGGDPNPWTTLSRRPGWGRLLERAGGAAEIALANLIFSAENCGEVAPTFFARIPSPLVSASVRHVEGLIVARVTR